jgi:hypothetical protein
MENITLDKFKIKGSWEEVTLMEFIQIKEILETPNFDEFEKELRIIALLAGQEDFTVFYNVPKIQAEQLFSSISFLNEQPKGDIKDLYCIGGVEYRFMRNVSDLKTGQYYDLTKYLEVKEDFFINLAKICSVFLLPTRNLSLIKRLNNSLYKRVMKTEKGQKITQKRRLRYFLPDTEPYLKTPLIETERNFLMNMKITDAMGLAVFFLASSAIYTEAILQYTEQEAIQSLKSAYSNLKQNKDHRSQTYVEQLDPLLQNITAG